MNMPINYRELVGDPIYGKGLTMQRALELDDPTFGYRVSSHGGNQPAQTPKTVTLSSLGIDTSSRLAFMCTLPEGTQVVKDKDGTVTYIVPIKS